MMKNICKMDEMKRSGVVKEQDVIKISLLILSSGEESKEQEKKLLVRTAIEYITSVSCPVLLSIVRVSETWA